MNSHISWPWSTRISNLVLLFHPALIPKCSVRLWDLRVHKSCFSYYACEFSTCSTLIFSTPKILSTTKRAPCIMFYIQYIAIIYRYIIIKRMCIFELLNISLLRRQTWNMTRVKHGTVGESHSLLNFCATWTVLHGEQRKRKLLCFGLLTWIIIFVEFPTTWWKWRIQNTS